MSFLQTELVSHARLVKSFYKRCIRQMQAYYYNQARGRLRFRYEAVKLRARFDENKDVNDFMKAKQLLADGEKELQQLAHYPLIKFATSPGGAAYDRNPVVPDKVLDGWHPQEKALYPDYFARRDIRKREYIERWQKKYGKSENEAGGH